LLPSSSVQRVARLGQHTARRTGEGRRCLQTTVNADEISHFSRLSSLWWDEKGEFGLLHKMNPVRMQFVREKILEVVRDEQGEQAALEMENKKDVLAGLDVLDVGCGGGLLSESLARLGAHTVGIDASESNIGIATLHASADPDFSASSSSGSLTYRHTSAEQLLQENKQFDVVCSMEVIEHVDNPAGFLEACAELVKPGGHLFISTVARTPLSYLLTIVAAEYILRKVAIGTHTYSKFINPSELISFFQAYRSPSASLALSSGSASPSASGNPESLGQPWISRTYEYGLPTRTEAELRGMIYVPFKGEWVLMPRRLAAWGTTECNYLFWVRKPKDQDL